jgi:hypothetical protein
MVNLSKVYLMDLKNSIKSMKPAELENLKNGDGQLLNLIISDKEIEPAKNELNKHIEETKKIACKSLI